MNSIEKKKNIYLFSFSQRPTAQQLRRLKFVSLNKSTRFLVELIERYRRWKESHKNGGGSDDGSSSDEDAYVQFSMIINTIKKNYVLLFCFF